MTKEVIESPIPSKNKTVAQLKNSHMKTLRSNSSVVDEASKRQRLVSPDINHAINMNRASSATPRAGSPRLVNNMDSDEILKKRLKYYNLDYADNKEDFLHDIYDPNSKWFSRSVKPEFLVEECIPYELESHKDQASYLCHIVVNLYIAINSLDIQGLISISSKDLADMKHEVDNLALKTDLFRLSETFPDPETLSSDIADFDEGEDEDDLFDENEFIDAGGPDFHATGKITAKSASIINVNHWTNELKNCMHFEFPITLRKSLAKVYYYLSLVKGQKVYRQMHVDMFDLLVNVDDDNTNYTDLLFEAGLRLDHHIMLQFLEDFLLHPESDLQLFRLLLKLAHSAKAFYDDEHGTVLTKSMEYLLSSLAPSTMASVMPIITSFVPYQYKETAKIVDYIPFCFGFWSSFVGYVGVDTHMYDFMGTVAEDAHWKLLKGSPASSFIKVNEFMILTEAQMSFMFNKLQNNLKTDGQIHSYSRAVRPFVYSLVGNKSEMYFEKLSELVKSIATYVHPSNSGFWTKTISKFVHSFIKMYHGRAVKEKKFKSGDSDPGSHFFHLNAECNAKLLNTFLDLLFSGAQNKNNDVSNQYISSLAYLIDLAPKQSHLVFSRILTDLYEALSGEHINSTHRLVASLKQFNRVVRYMVMDKIYRVHTTNVLMMLVSKIDMNDIILTSNIINGIVSIASFIPIQNLVEENEYITFESNTLPFIEQHYYHFRADHSTSEFLYDEEILKNAFRASTTIFENALRTYVDKLFQLADVDLEDGFVTKLNQTTLILVESMDDRMFTAFSDIFRRKFWDNDSFKEKNPHFELVTIPLACLVRNDSSLSKPLFQSLTQNIREQVGRGAGSIRGSTEIQPRDLKLVLYLSALNDILRQSGKEILAFKDELIEFLKYIYDNITNPPLDVFTSVIIHHACASLTSTEVVDYRLFPKTSKIPSDQRWGGLQFDKRKFLEEHIDFAWHVPTAAEVSLAIEMFETVIDHCINRVKSLMESPETDSAYTDRLQKYILIVTHALSGSSLLFDPDYNKNSTISTPGKDYREKLLLLKSIRDNNCDTEELDIDIEQIRSEVDRNSSDNPNNSSVLQMSNEDNSFIEVKNEDSNDVIMEEVTEISALPSGIATPEPGTHFGGNVNSCMNSRLIFRDLDIYACNYYFGTSVSEKLKNPQYLQVHNVRNRVGVFFHKLYKFLQSNYDNNTNVFQILLHGIKVFFTDVGQETVFNDDPNAFLDLDFLENIQSLNGLSLPYTRTCLAANANDFHQARVLLHSTNRHPSTLEAQLLCDIINLSTSVYPDIHKPAQGTLLHCMKQFIGSYSIIINKAISCLKQVLLSGNYMKMEAVLKLFMMKKINRKLMSDYKNLKELILLLVECYKVNELEIAMQSDQILNEIASGLKIPSSVCILDSRAKTTLAPPDKSIDLQVEAVRRAKDKKRRYYFSLLENLQSELLLKFSTKENFGWKLPVFMMRLVNKLQLNLETTVDQGVISFIYIQMKSNHPGLIHLGVKTFFGIFDKISTLSDYDYDIPKVYDSNYELRFTEKLDTSIPNMNVVFNKEMNNFKSPNFFIDSRMYVGWLCWGRSVEVMKPVRVELNVRENERESLEIMGSLISKEWLKMTTENLVQDNETHGVFSSCNVSFFIMIMCLISNGYTALKLDDIFDLCREHYNRDDKAAMIMSIEIFAALVCSSKMLKEKELKFRDEFVDNFLQNCLNVDLNQDASDIWSTMCWWLPTTVDIRRCEPFYRQFSQIHELLNTNSDDAGHQASKLLMLKSMIMSLEYKNPNIAPIFDSLTMQHPYDQVREAIAQVLCSLITTQSCPSWENVAIMMEAERVSPGGLGLPVKQLPAEIDNFIKRQFLNILEESRKVEGLTPQEILKTKFFYMSSTMFYWINEMARSSNKILLVPYVVDYLAPFLLTLLKHKDVCKLSGLDPVPQFIGLSYMPIRRENIGALVKLLCNTNLTSSSFQIKLQLRFIQHFFSSQLLQLTKAEKDYILNALVDHLYNQKYVEVRTSAADVLSNIVHNLGEKNQELQLLVDRFNSGLGNYSWKEKQKLSKTDTNVHGSILGLGAIISAFPYAFPLPQWIPRQLSNISSWARTNGMAASASKSIISEFKKVRTDTWKFDRLAFTAEQLEDLEGVLWSSYYA